MAGVGKLLKQAQKMQKQMQVIQEELAQKEIEVSSGGGAISLTVNGQGEFKALSLDSEFLKEDAEFVAETILSAIQEAAVKAKSESEDAMGAATGGLGGFPGLM